MMKKLLLSLITLVFILAGCAGQQMRSGPSVADQMAEGEASANSYTVNNDPSLTLDYLLGINDFGGTWGVNRFDLEDLKEIFQQITYSLDNPDNWDMTNLVHNAVLEANAAGTATLDAVGSDTQIDFCIKTRGTGAVTIAVNAADTAFLDGVTETQGEDILSDGTAGGMICCSYGGAANTLSCIGDGTWDGATD